MTRRGWCLALGAWIAAGCAGRTTSTPGKTITVRWDRNPSPGLTGYRLYVGRASQRYDFAIDLEPHATGARYTLYHRGDWFFALTTQRGETESAFSPEVHYTR